MKKLLLLASVSAGLVFTGCGNHQEEAETIKLVATTVIKKDTITFQDYVCQINSIQHIELRALEKGYLQNIYVDEGQILKRGQKMFQIMPMVYNAEKQKAQAEANSANIEYENTLALANKNVVSQNELAIAKAKYEKAKAELDLAGVHLGFTEIKAPFNGIVGRFHVRLGSLINEGDLLTTLSDNSQMWVYFNVPEAEYLNYKSNIKKETGIPVQLVMANNKIFNKIGKVEVIEADFNNETGNIAFRALFPNPNGLLRHGETGNIRMTIDLPNALLIPQKATFEVLDRRYVYVIDKSNKLITREINVLAELEDIYAISKGLQEGDKILLDGLRKVRDGDIIKYDLKNATEVLSDLKVYAE